jgi:hypothetical protein
MTSGPIHRGQEDQFTPAKESMSELPQIVHPSAHSWDLFENRELSLTSDQAKTPPIACAEWLQKKHARPERQALRDRDNPRVRPILDD